jgi:hypothetical protein
VVRLRESIDLDISIGDTYAATRAAVTTAEFLCTGLDESLLLVDSFWESLLALVGKHFWYVFLIPFWSLRGKAALKHEIARRSGLNAAHLPHRPELVEFLQGGKFSGRKLVLATGAEQMPKLLHVLAASASARCSYFGFRGWGFLPIVGNGVKIRRSLPRWIRSVMLLEACCSSSFSRQLNAIPL